MTPLNNFSSILTDMYYKSKRASLLILGISSLVCSRSFFALLDDPEGPNLLIVVVMAVILYSLSLVAYLYALSVVGLQRVLLAICIQVVIVAGLYFFLS